MKLFTICAFALLTTVGCGPAPAPVVDAGKPAPVAAPATQPVVVADPVAVTPEVRDAGPLAPAIAPSVAASQPVVAPAVSAPVPASK